MTAEEAARQGTFSRRLRASDADRSAVASALGEHYAHGRLDDEEFDARSTRALSAVYVDELDGLFHDLPPARPTQPAAPVVARRPAPPRSRSTSRRPPVAVLVMVAVAVVVLTRGAALWLLPLMWLVAGSARSCARGRRHPALQGRSSFASSYELISRSAP